MKQLKIKIWNEENVVLMKVLQQDENIISQIPDIYTAENGLGIASWHYPDVTNRHIFIRGDDKESDNKVCCRDFDTVQQAEEYVSKVKEAVAEYNASIKEILDEQEKEYLKAVIKPFRNKVEYIEKRHWFDRDYEYIKIALGNDTVGLPFFKKGKMYKGMTFCKNYTLEQLGL